MRAIRLISLSILLAILLFAQTGHSITLTWVPNSDTSGGGTGGDPVVTYNILRGTTSGGESSTPIGTLLASACTATLCTYIDTTVVGGATYFYEITATNAMGTSGPSPEVSFSVSVNAPNAPAKPTITGK